MKVGYILPSLANKGPILVCRDIVCELVDKIECEIFYFDEILEVSFPCRTTKISFFGNIDFDAFDVIHTHMFRPDLYIFLKKYTKKIKCKLVTTIHTSIYHDLTFAYSKLSSRFLPRIWMTTWSVFDRLVVLSAFAKNYYKLYESKIVIIFNGRHISSDPISIEDLDLFSNVKKKYKKIIGTVASFDERKGLDQVIRALPYLPEYAFIIVGSGSEEVKNKLLLRASELNVECQVYFLGPRKEGNRYIPHFDIFILPSISESFPLALLEAVAHRTPVICSQIPVFEEIFNKDCVAYFELYNIRELTSTIAGIEEHQKSLIDNAFKVLEKNYTCKKMGENYYTLYSNMITI